MSKKVSVVVPVYGVEKFIAATLKSILDQTYQNLEILIIDDASPDKSIEICQQFSDPRIRIISQANRGLAGARNTGIRNATGEYIALLDGDDLWMPKKVEKHIQHLETNPKVGISFSRSAFIDAEGKDLESYQMPKLAGISPPDLLLGNPVGNGSSPVIRREVFKEIEFIENRYGAEESFYFDESFRQTEDIECWMRMALTTEWEFAGIPDALTLYRVNSGGLSANLLKQFEAYKRVLAKIQTYAPEFITEWEKPAIAYNLQYLARTAVRLKDGKMTVNLLNQALSAYGRILLEQPRRVILTGIAGYLLWLLPPAFYQQIDQLARKTLGANQKRQILQESKSSQA